MGLATMTFDQLQKSIFAECQQKKQNFLCVTHKIIVLFSNKKLMILQKNTFWKRQILNLAETKLTNLRLAEWLLCATHIFFFAWARISCCELQIWNWVFSTKLSAREMLLQATFPVAIETTNKYNYFAQTWNIYDCSTKIYLWKQINEQKST